MGRRNHDWTLCPELMARHYPPASSWPSVSDIPPGMLVLDAGGVVKVKVANELLTMDEFSILLVNNGEPVTQNGQAILVDDIKQIIYGVIA